jgi:L-methionine (R)-S-oxide reductase
VSKAKIDMYQALAQQSKAIISNEYDWIANLANLSALLFNGLQEINWAGFYLYKEEQLILGPFQGQVACIRIPLGKGVCGSAAQNRETLVIEDVHQFDGHIACDAASNSEIVVPIVIDNELRGVLDIDSPAFARFDDDDKQGLERIVGILTAHYEQQR